MRYALSPGFVDKNDGKDVNGGRSTSVVNAIYLSRGEKMGGGIFVLTESSNPSLVRV